MNGGAALTPGLVSDTSLLGLNLCFMLLGLWAFSNGIEDQTSLHNWTAVWGGSKS